MSLERLWAAWRGEYLGVADGAVSGERVDTADEEPGRRPADCVFCRILREPDAAAMHVLHVEPLAWAVLNAFPYTSGHLLVLPRRHVADLVDLDVDEAAALWDVALDGMRAVRAAYRPDGVNLGANIGRAAGAGVPGHVHLHVLPRWYADTNFTTTVAETRVMPEALRMSGDRLRQAWPR